ncbi:MAG: hypothetical protein ACLVKA_03710 [Collinsella aerofaciens]
MTATEDLLDFIAESPHDVSQRRGYPRAFDAAGFTYLSEGRMGGAPGRRTTRSATDRALWPGVWATCGRSGFASDVAKAADAAAGSADAAAGSAGDSAPYHFQLGLASDSPASGKDG